MSSPQLEDGYTRLANELLEAVLAFDFSKRELKIVFAIFRKTYGWGKKQDQIALSQFEALTGIKKNHVSTTLAGLVAKKVVLKQDYTYSINKAYQDWQLIEQSAEIAAESQNRTSPKTGLKPVPKQDQSQNRTSPETGLQTSPEMGAPSPKTGLKPSPKMGTTKETKKTITKERKEKDAREDAPTFEPPSWINAEYWSEFMLVRKKLKAVNSDLALKIIVRKLTRWRDDGHDPNEIILQSITSAWKDVYEPKQVKQNKSSGGGGTMPAWLFGESENHDFIDGEVITHAKLN